MDDKLFVSPALAKKLSSIEKAIYIVSVLAENYDTIVDVGFKDPFEKGSVFEEGTREITLSIKFRDDGRIKTALIRRIEEYEKQMEKELNEVKAERSRYE